MKCFALALLTEHPGQQSLHTLNGTSGLMPCGQAANMKEKSEQH
jgi:hypothetical protein